MIIDTDLRFSQYVNTIIKKNFVNLELVNSQRSIINQQLKKMLCDSILLSHFNFADVIYGLWLLRVDANIIQLIQNAYVRLIGGIKIRQVVTVKPRVNK